MTYNTSVVSHNSEVVMSTSNSHETLDLQETDYNWQSNTTYFVSVTACTSAGCSRDCGNTTILTGGVLVVRGVCGWVYILFVCTYFRSRECMCSFVLICLNIKYYRLVYPSLV